MRRWVPIWAGWGGVECVCVLWSVLGVFVCCGRSCVCLCAVPLLAVFVTVLSMPPRSPWPSAAGVPSCCSAAPQALEHTPEVFGTVEMLYVNMEVSCE